jgi:gluconolactonase
VADRAFTDLYVTSSIEDKNGIVEVFSSTGKLLGTIDVGIKVTNGTFGGPDRRTLFITAARSLWAVDLRVPGLP